MSSEAMNRARAATAEFKALLAARGCPDNLPIEEAVLQGFASMAEAEELRQVYEAAMEEEY